MSGLRDPLATEPSSLLAAAGIPVSDVTAHWQLYQALDPQLVAGRARLLLRAPDEVTLQFADGVLTAGGVASTSWLVDSQRVAPLIPGVTRYDARPLIEGALSRVAQQLEASPLQFTRGSTAFETGSDEILRTHLARIRELDALAQAAGARYRIEITGHADADGPPAQNEPLSVRRATRVRSAIEALGLSRIDLAADGVGSRQPLRPNATEAEKRLNRRVALRLLSVPAPSGKPGS